MNRRMENLNKQSYFIVLSVRKFELVFSRVMNSYSFEKKEIDDRC